MRRLAQLVVKTAVKRSSRARTNYIPVRIRQMREAISTTSRFFFQPVKPTAVRPLLNTQASIPTTGSTATIKSNMLSSSTPSKTIPMTPSHSSPSSTSNHIATTNVGNFATVAASHSNSQAIHSTSNKTSSKTFVFCLFLYSISFPIYFSLSL